jgi:hypothetical protein
MGKPLSYLKGKLSLFDLRISSFTSLLFHVIKPGWSGDNSAGSFK